MKTLHKILVAGLLALAVMLPTAVAVIHSSPPHQTIVRIAEGPTPTPTPDGGSTNSSGGCQGGGGC